ncbi:MAG TPA: sulfatase, partial [Terriglobia bacterium]|nr:sulfatase [Terriglobia bacterium]
MLDLIFTSIRRPRLGWVLYALLVGYAAINVPIARILSSPMTWTMMRAARGPLRDSITHYFTVPYFGAVALILTAGILLPVVLGRLKFQHAKIAGVAALAVVAIGPYAVTQVDSAGMHRNAFGVLWPTHLGRTTSGDAGGWRISPFESAPATDLSRFRGSAAGRNVILILLESTAARYLKPYGAAEDPMPNLTRLASQSIVFDRAYAVYPESIRELFATLCSQYPQFGTSPETYAAGPAQSVTGLLHDAGYRTALFHSGRFMYLGMESVIQNHGFDTLEDAGAIGGNVNSSFGVDEPAAVERILSWIDALPSGQRFFVTYLPVAGHHPYATPERGTFPDDSDENRYRNALEYGDQSLGALVAGLRKRKLDEKTLFVIFGDHGEAFGRHDGNFGHSLFIYDENIRVPYIVAAPGLIQDTVRSRSTASVIDTAPTILDMLGMQAPSGFQGISLLDASPRMALFFTDYSLGLLGLYDSCWKYILETDSGRAKLFNVCQDPDELHDLSGEQVERERAYRSKVQGWIAAQKGN